MSLIPADVLGGSIEAMFSTRLRGRLQEGREQKDIVGRNRPKPWAEIQQDRREGWGKGETGLLENESRRHSNLAPEVTGQDGNDWSLFANKRLIDTSLSNETGVWLPKTDGLTQAFREHEHLSQLQDNHSIFATNGLTDTSLPSETGVWLPKTDGLAQALREYEQLSQSQDSRLKTRLESEDSSKDRQRTSQGVGGVRVGVRPPTTWPHLTGEEVATRLQTFVENTSRGGDLPTANEAFSTSSKSHGWIQNSFHIQVNMGSRNTDETTGDLSEQIAGVLREQAMQYGIDLT